jgi:hypothetical protein
MPSKRRTSEQIVNKLCQADVELAKGQKVTFESFGPTLLHASQSSFL